MVHSILYRAFVILVVYDVGHNLIRNLRRVGARKRRLRVDGRLKRRKNSVFKICGYLWTVALYDMILKMKRFHEIS